MLIQVQDENRLEDQQKSCLLLKMNMSFSKVIKYFNDMSILFEYLTISNICLPLDSRQE